MQSAVSLTSEDVKMLATMSPMNIPMEMDTHVGNLDKGLLFLGCMLADCRKLVDGAFGWLEASHVPVQSYDRASLNIQHLNPSRPEFVPSCGGKCQTSEQNACDVREEERASAAGGRARGNSDVRKERTKSRF